MKLAILSDFHLGYERFSEDAYSQAKEALELAAEKADALVIPGDIFDFRAPKPEVIAQAINLFRDMKSKMMRARVVDYVGEREIYTDIPILAIPGTHERRAVNSENAVDLLGLAGLLVNASEAMVTLEKNGEKVAVYGLGGVSEEKLGQALADLAPKPKDGMFSVFFFHQSVYELLPFSSEFIKLADLPQGFDLYVNGHIHRRFEGKVHGSPFLIPGSTVLTQLKDGEQEEKGIFIFDTQSREYDFHRIHSRKFVVKAIDVSNAEDLKEKISSAIESVAASSDKPVVRIVLKGKTKGMQADIDLHSIVKRFEGKAYVEISKDRTEPGDDVHVAELRSGMLENASIRDFGIGIFTEKLKENAYKGSVGPEALFDVLSIDKKEEAIKRAMALCFDR